MEEITDKLGRTFKRRLRPLSTESINKTVVLLGSIMESAVEDEDLDGLVKRNPAMGRDKRARDPKPKKDWIDTVDGLTALLDAAGELDREARADRQHIERRASIATLMFAGLRTDEMLALQEGDPRLEAELLNVDGTKTATADRKVRVCGYLKQELEALRQRRSGVEWRPDRHLFPTRTGGKMKDDNYRNRVLKAAVKRANENLTKAGLPPLPDKVDPRCLRRTFCTIRYALGDGPEVVMEEMGHTDPAMALRAYRQRKKWSEHEVRRAGRAR